MLAALLMLVASNSIPQNGVITDNTPDVPALMFEIDGKWMSALERAITEFNKLKKQSLGCYKVMAYLEKDVLAVYFYGKPDVFNSGLRGQPKSCGPSIIYYINEKAELVDFDYLR